MAPASGSRRADGAPTGRHRGVVASTAPCTCGGGTAPTPHSPTRSTTRSTTWAGQPVAPRPPRIARRRRSPTATRCARRRCASPPSAPPAGCARSRRPSRERLGGLVRRRRPPRRRHRRRRAGRPGDPRRTRHDGRPLGARPRRHGRRRARRARRGDAAVCAPAAATSRSSRSTPPSSTPSPAPASPTAAGARRCPPSARPPSSPPARRSAPSPPRPGARSAAASPTPTSCAALATRFDRHRRRLRGEPVVVPQVRLVLPDDLLDDWEVRLELVDELDPGRWCTADDVWDRTAARRRGRRRRRRTSPAWPPRCWRSPRTLAECVEVAAELPTATEPSSLELDRRGGRAVPRAGAGRARRHAASTCSAPSASCAPASPSAGRPRRPTPADHGRRFGREAIVDWRLVVADDDGPAAITDAELARAERDGATLLHTGQRWVRIDPAAMRRARERLDEHRREHAVVDAVTLLRLAGDGEVDAGDAPPSARSWTDELLAGLPDERLERGARAGRLHRRAAAVPAARPRLAALPRAPRPRRLPRRRHGPRQDGRRRSPTSSTGPARTSSCARCRSSTTGSARRPASRRRCACVVHHGAERRRRRRARRRRPRRSRRTACCRATSSTSAAVRWSHRRRRRGADDQEPGARTRPRRCAPLPAGQKLALTGTPVENRLAELWAILDAVNPGLLGSRERFRHRFAKPIERDGDGDAAARLRRITAAVRAAPHEGRPPARARPARQDRADRLGRAHPRAGRAVPARRRPAARRRRATPRA